MEKREENRETYSCNTYQNEIGCAQIRKIEENTQVDLVDNNRFIN